MNVIHSNRQGREPDATGYNGFYDHFLDMQTGKRMWNCELSPIDTATLIAGVLKTKRIYEIVNQATLPAKINYARA